MTAYYNENDPAAAEWLRSLIKAGLIAPGDVDDRSIKDVRPEDLQGYTQCHWFAGIGGWSYALRLASWADDVPVWTGSCPCQPFSTSGKRKGIDDERHLWPEMFRLIRECRPDCVFGEQVENAVRHGWLDGVCADLEGEGYAVGATVLGAHSVGAPHIRQRLYWVADAAGFRRERECYSSSASVQGECAERGWEHSRSGQAGELSRRPEGLCRPCRLADSQDADWRRAVGASDGGRRAAQEAGGSGYADAWGEFSLIPCADGKVRRIVTRLALLDDGVQYRVVNSITSSKSASSKGKQVADHAKSSQAGPSQDLPVLRNSNGEEAIRRGTGVHDGIQVPEALQSSVHGSGDGRENKKPHCEEQSQAVAENRKERMRGLRENEGAVETPCPPHRREPAKQRAIQLEDALRLMPSAYALAVLERDSKTSQALRDMFPSCVPQEPLQHAPLSEMAAWRPPSDGEVERAWRAGLFDGFGFTAASPLVAGCQRRATALRGLGNAIVPQVAAEFIKAYMEVSQAVS